MLRYRIVAFMTTSDRIDPRIVRTRQRALQAATELLAERGYSNFSVDAVVDRTGIAKTTLYRHWPSKDGLIRAVIGQLGHSPVPPDTGSVREDLMAYFGYRARAAGTPQWNQCIPALIEAAAHQAELATGIADLTRAALQQLQLLLSRGIARGELRDDLDLELAASTLIGPIVFRRLLLQEKPDPKRISAIVDLAVRGMAR